MSKPIWKLSRIDPESPTWRGGDELDTEFHRFAAASEKEAREATREYFIKKRGNGFRWFVDMWLDESKTRCELESANRWKAAKLT